MQMVSWPFDSNKFEQDSNDLAFPTWIYFTQNENTIQKIVKTNFIPGLVGNPNGTPLLVLTFLFQQVWSQMTKHFPLVFTC